MSNLPLCRNSLKIEVPTPPTKRDAKTIQGKKSPQFQQGKSGHSWISGQASNRTFVSLLAPFSVFVSLRLVQY